MEGKADDHRQEKREHLTDQLAGAEAHFEAFGKGVAEGVKGRQGILAVDYQVQSDGTNNQSQKQIKKIDDQSRFCDRGDYK